MLALATVGWAGGAIKPRRAVASRLCAGRLLSDVKVGEVGGASRGLARLTLEKCLGMNDFHSSWNL